jgi:hypothetical protein
MATTSRRCQTEKEDPAHDPHLARDPSGMASPLVLEMPDGLELQRRVSHVEVTGQAVLKVVEHPTCVTGLEAVVAHDDVRSQDGQR